MHKHRYSNKIELKIPTGLFSERTRATTSPRSSLSHSRTSFAIASYDCYSLSFFSSLCVSLIPVNIVLNSSPFNDDNLSVLRTQTGRNHKIQVASKGFHLSFAFILQPLYSSVCNDIINHWIQLFN